MNEVTFIYSKLSSISIESPTSNPLNNVLICITDKSGMSGSAFNFEKPANKTKIIKLEEANNTRGRLQKNNPPQCILAVANSHSRLPEVYGEAKCNHNFSDVATVTVCLYYCSFSSYYTMVENTQFESSPIKTTIRTKII